MHASVATGFVSQCPRRDGASRSRTPSPRIRRTRLPRLNSHCAMTRLDAGATQQGLWGWTIRNTKMHHGNATPTKQDAPRCHKRSRVISPGQGVDLSKMPLEQSSPAQSRDCCEHGAGSLGSSSDMSASELCTGVFAVRFQGLNSCPRSCNPLGSGWALGRDCGHHQLQPRMASKGIAVQTPALTPPVHTNRS